MKIWRMLIDGAEDTTFYTYHLTIKGAAVETLFKVKIKMSRLDRGNIIIITPLYNN